MADDVEVDVGAEWEISPSRLELVELIGSGCTAEVYRGMLDTTQEVAVKQIDWDKSMLGVKEQRAFEREIAILPKVNHVNLVQFIGVASLERPLRIITELCTGGCVFDLLHNQEDLDLTWPQRHKMCLDVASAMEYLHSFDPQIIHRDLKSLNLLLERPVVDTRAVPLVKVSDFGLSRMKNSEDGWGKMTMAAGTCHWMAPEVMAGDVYDEKVDVYSFAMIVFEVICREVPWEDEEVEDVGRLTIEGQRPDLEAVPPNCPRHLFEIMIACWDAQAAKRPSFTSVVQHLRRVTGGAG